MNKKQNILEKILVVMITALAIVFLWGGGLIGQDKPKKVPEKKDTTKVVYKKINSDLKVQQQVLDSLIKVDSVKKKKK